MWILFGRVVAQIYVWKVNMIRCKMLEHQRYDTAFA